MNVKKIIIAALSLALIMGSYSAAFAATPPSDIQGESCEEAVSTLVKAGAITGDIDGLFHPEENLTRAQACIIIVKTMNPLASAVNGTATQAGAGSDFSDLGGYSWAAGYIGYAVENGIVKGYPGGMFKPGNQVTTNEMLTMLLRASRVSEDEIGPNWPEDYISKAKMVGILNGIDEDYPQTATKGMAAQMTFNQIDKLKASAVTEEQTPQGTNADVPKTAPTSTGLTFATANFNDNMTTFGGKKISSKVTIYTYGIKADYNEKMVLSTKASDYRLDTLYKYRGAKTTAWYGVENGEITTMILPRDMGFSGQAYGVVNKTVTVQNASNESVTGFQTLTAAKEITWLGKKSLTTPTITQGDGQLYELLVERAEIQNIATAETPKGKYFKELTDDREWTDVFSYDNGVIKLNDENGAGFTVKTKATIYLWDNKTKEYKEGTVTSISDSKKIRAYDISDDDVTAADIVVLTER